MEAAGTLLLQLKSPIFIIPKFDLSKKRLKTPFFFMNFSQQQKILEKTRKRLSIWDSSIE